VPSDLALKTMNAVHRVLIRFTAGRKGWTFSNMPVIALTTIGRKSGLPREVMLTSPLQEDGSYVVVASRGGDDRPPVWLLNLTSNPAVEARVAGGPKQHMRARVATPDERSRLWPRVVADHAMYSGYQTKTDRVLALVLLTPSDLAAR
jgi:deazaflavin-dependent oxidoreductase (nitroreductase family)